VNRAKPTDREPPASSEKVGIDDLTGVWNRAGFLAAATPMFVSCQRRHAPVTLGYFDIRTAGTTRPAADNARLDNALRAIAQQMGKTFRDCDVIGRIDRFRFAVLFADCTDDTLGAIEGVRAVTDQSTPPNENILTVAVVESSPGETLDDLMRKANQRMNEPRRGAASGAPHDDATRTAVPAKPTKRRARTR
jgi:GGDEF domain-containing protein